jgi:membrane fusion protein, heavy metal efflux system
VKHPNRTSLASLVVCLSVLATAGCPSGGGEGGHEGHDHGAPGASGDEVGLTDAQVEAAGIKIQAARPGTVTERLRLTAVVQENLDAQAHLTPKVPGLVVSIHKQLGDRVEVGEVLCELDSTQLGEAASSFMEAQASLEAGQETLLQETALLERGVEVARTIFEREERLKDDEITTLRPYYEAEKALAEAQLARDSRLLTLRGDVRMREIHLHTAEERLRILGLSSENLADLERDEEHGHGRYPLLAPRAGVIVARDITINEYVDTSSKLFLIQDPSRVWVVASVYERDLRRVERGQAAEVRLAAFPDVTLRGQVTLISNRVDPVSRACQVRIELPNEPIQGWSESFPLRPGMFGTVELVLAEHQAAVTVPERAIVHEGERSYVFVAVGGEDGHDEDEHGDEHGDEHDEDEAGHEGHDHGDEDAHDEDESGHEGHDHGDEDHADEPRQVFVRRAVDLGAVSADLVEITSGLSAGERVVVEGTFTLKSAARQGELGGGHSH